MKIHALYTTLFLSLLFIPFNSRAEYPQISRFDKFTQDNGLSSNHVLCIFQEEAGWMWFGTSLGLNRYDGYQFTVYKSDVDGFGTLRGDLVRCIFEDKNNRIWVGTERGGLNLFDRDKERFSHFTFKDAGIDTIFSVNCIVTNENKRLFLGTNKGVAFLNADNRLEIIPIKALEEAGNPEVTKIFFDKNNNLWIGTLSGLFVYDFSLEKGERKPLPETSIPYDEIHSLFFDSDNILWIGTYNSGVYTANVNSGIVKKWAWIKFARSETVRTIREDKQGIMWFGTRGGLVSYNKVSQNYNSFLRDEDENLSLSLNSVLSLCVDSKGDLWIGTRGGINYRNIDKQVFIHIKASNNDNRFLNNAEIYCFYLHGNDLLVGTESGGVNIYNTTTHRFKYLTTQNGLSGNCVKAFVKEGDELLIGTYQGGISVVDANNYRVKTILRNKTDDSTSLKDDVVWSLLKDKQGNIWVATNKGIDLYNSKNRTFTHRPDIFPNRACNWIKEDSSGDLWLGGDELVIYNPQTCTYRKYNERTRDFIATANNQYWLATRGHGLALFEKEKGSLEYFTESDGLCNNNIQSLRRDEAGYIWISTFNGLSRFDEKTKKFINFDVNDGLQDNQFNYGAAFYDGENLIYGGINGINIFNPGEIRKNSFAAPIVFTGLKLFNRPVEIGTSIEKSINVLNSIELESKQNAFTIEFAALSFANSHKNEYVYMLEKFDENWIPAGSANSATYTNLYSGKYLFRVKASDSNGVWSPYEARMEVIIHPPFWNTWWFRLIAITLVALFLIYLSQFYLNRAKLHNELVFEKTRARKLHEIEILKLRFFTNISHEIRTPLTLILGPLNQVLEQGEIDSESKNKLQLVKRNADQLLKLINQLLDFRKLEAGKQGVHYEKSDLVLFVKTVVESFQSMSIEKGIKLTFSSNKDSLVTWFDNDKIQKIVNNLLSNALKFTNSSGYVSVTLTLCENFSSENAENQSFYTITVKDTGIGISQKNLGKIFERFEQGGNGKNTRGSGIGLSITREFVKLMEGEIEVESIEEQGTSFLVRLPLLLDADVEKEKDVKEKTEDTLLSGKNQRIILLAEDNADVREYTASNFRSEYKIIEAENGKEACELAMQYIPDIIISDLLMPVMNGDALCKKIKKDERTSHIPFILLTAVTSKESEKESLKVGADDYITKPFDVNILKLKVDNLLSLRDALRDKYKNDFLRQPSPIALVSPDEKFLKKAVDIIEHNIDDPDYDIETFSSDVGVSRMQLYRKLEALTNMTVKEFIRDIRIKRAAQLLEQNKANVSEIIYQVGFRDLAYFRKCFREQYGISPSEYAAKFKKEEREM
jgi:signal transduction histidine kinase/ligand-binding sensor domain-containing protein/DNA-binding response OmpR family regulator